MGRFAFASSRWSEFRSALNAACQGAWSRICRRVDNLARYRRSLRVAFWVLLALVSFGVVLDLGTWRGEDESSGPFRAATRASGQYAIDVGRSVPVWLRIRLVDDSPFAMPPAGARLSRDGRAIDLPPLPRPQLALSTRSPLGLRYRELTFALPDGVANDDRLRLTARYTITYHRTFYDIVLACFILIAALRLILARHRLELALRPPDDFTTPDRPLDRILPHVLLLFPLVSVLIIVACLAYASTIVYGVVAGHALPTATAFHLMPRGLLSGIEPYVPPAILIFAAFGTVIAWAGSFRILPEEPIRQTERMLLRIWAGWGLPVIVCLFLFSLSAGGWSGNIRFQDQNYVSLAGLVPHSDARAYFTDAYRAAFFGDWDVLGSRRPLGEAFRQAVVMAGGYSYVRTLLVQLCLIAVALYIAARFVAGRSGVWAGIAFVALIYILTRSFLYTTLTEPLALVWTLLSIVFLLEAFRLNSLSHALVAFAALTFALFTRMGSMFTIPVLAVWIAYAFASTWRSRLKTFGYACGVVIAVVSLNALLAFLYASPHVATGSNFGYSLCGLSLGTDWSGCSRVYEAQLRTFPNEREQATFLFAVAWQNILAQPTVLLSKLLDNVISYFGTIPEVVLEGYSPGYDVSPAISKVGVLGLITSLVLLHRLHGKRTEISFWALVFLSSGMSAAIILADDGWRTMHVTNALIALFVATGFSAPTVVAPRLAARPLPWRRGVAAIAAVAVLFVAGPSVSTALMSADAQKYRGAGAAGPGDMIVPGGRFVTGFQVIEDGSSRPLRVPTLFFSEFVKLVRMTNIEGDFGAFIDIAARRMPFALIVSGRFDNANQSNIFIAPVSMLEHPAVAAWHLQVREGPPGGAAWNTLREAVAATPIP